MNNRSSGRRRGRGGRANANRGPADGNRVDNRARGNANQLLEKYKGLARDAHQQGDRVMNEYYLQFADHYFRILAEANQRKEDQQREREESRKARRRDEDEDEIEARDESDDEEERQPAPKKQARRPRKSEANEGNGRDRDDDGDGDERIEADRLPAAIAVDDEGEGHVNGKSPAKPSRARRPKTGDGDDAVAAEA